MTKSKAEELAIEWLKTEYSAQDLDEFALDKRQEDERTAFLAGFKAAIKQAGKMSRAGADWKDDLIRIVRLSDLRKLMGINLKEQDG